MYSNYLLKIDNVIFPGKYIADKSFKVTSKPIVLNDYYDGNYDRHVIYAPQNEITIEFKIPKLLESDFSIAYGLIKKDCTISYYNAATGSYESGSFILANSVIPAITTVINGKVVAEASTIKYIKKRAN